MHIPAIPRPTIYVQCDIGNGVTQSPEPMGFLALGLLQQAVGIPEEECVDQIAGEYWIMRRIRRWETATTLTQLYELAASEPDEVRREIT